MLKKQALLVFVTLAIMDLLIGCSNVPSRENSADDTAGRADAAISDAIKALRKIDAATEVGVNQFQYAPLVIDAKAVVNEALPKIPNGELKTEITSAMNGYADAVIIAARANDPNVVSGDQLFLDPRERVAVMLRDQYSVPYDTAFNGVLIFARSTILPTVWQSAKAHLDRASELRRHNS